MVGWCYRGGRTVLAAVGLVCAAASVAASPRVCLNEVLSSDNTLFADEDGSFEDWVELLNAGDAEASLSGWGLSDEAEEDPFKWTFPDITLKPGEHLLVWASGKDRRPLCTASDGPVPVVGSNTVWRYRSDGSAPASGWTLLPFDDAAWLSGPAMLGYGSTEVKTLLSYGDNSLNKYPAAYFRQSFVLPMATNAVHGNGVLRLWADDGAIVYLNGAEILRVRMPAGTVTSNTYASTLVNSRGLWESFDVSLEALVPGTNVLAVEIHQYNATSSDLCFWAQLEARLSQFHTNFKISAGNETVTLTDAGGLAVDEAPALSVLSGSSFGRASGDPGGAWVMFPYPTPGTTNAASGYEGLLAPPVFTVAPGFYENAVTVAITNADATATIYYTLDGSTPTNAVTESCFLYSAPLTLDDRSSEPNRFSMIRTNPIEMTNHTQYGWMEPQGLVPKANVVRAMAFRKGLFSPRGAAGTWFVGGATLQHALRVVSLMSDPDNLFGDPLGLFVPGDVYNTLGWNGHYVGLPNANYFLSGGEWERPVFFQMFEADRTLAVSQLMGVRNHGAWSRAAAQKTMRFYAREEYGDSQVRYPVFPQQSDAAFKRFLMRNSGNDWSSTGFRDAMMHQLFRPLARCNTQDCEPAVLYVDGEYWGVLNLREYYSNYYLERLYGVDPESLDLLKATVSSETMEIEEGDDLDYKEVLGFVKTNDLSLAANYAWVESRMDLDNLIDHYACEIYCCNTDWPGNNLGVWRVRTAYNPNAPYGHDGRWRWLTYDTDHGFGLSSSITTDMMTQARRSSRGVCQPHFDRLLANADFRNRFINRFTDLINTAFKPARVQGVISNMALRVESEMPRHIARWGRMGSVSAWQTRVQSLKTFAAGRPGPALTNVMNEFGLEGLSSLTVSITNGAGSVTVNSVTLNAHTPGLADPEHPFPWSGVYFRTVPVTVNATPALGFTFARWETPWGDVDDPALTFTPSNDVSVTAVFEPAVMPRISVNECMADANRAGCDPHPVTAEASDWFELLNESAVAVDLGGYWLVDSQEDNACAIPEGVTIGPGECLRVWADSDLSAEVNADGSFNVTFGLSKAGDAVALLSPDRSVELDRVTFGAQTPNVSQGRWPNGATGAWVSFSRPTPEKPNCNPAVTFNLLPHYTVQTVDAAQLLSVSLAPIETVADAVYVLVEGPEGAAVDAEGLFTWTPSLAVGSGVYAFRVALMGKLGGAAVTDEATLLVAVTNTERYLVDGAASPAEGGSVSGGGAYVYDASVVLTAVPTEGWRFASWSDGLSSASRSVTVRHDATYTARFTADLAVPSGAGAILQADAAPRLYWRAVSGAERYVVRRAPSPAGPFTVVGEPVNNVFCDAQPLVGLTGYYTVSASRGGSEGDACGTFMGYTNGVTRELTGPVIGTLGSYGNNPSRTRDKVFDGDIATFYDAAADGGWPGMDLGAERLWHLDELRYVPRESLPARMVNGRFQTARVSDGVDTFEILQTLHQITTQPPTGVYTRVSLQLDADIRYLRYLPPPGGWGNIAELDIYGCEAQPSAPCGLTATSGVGTVSLAWEGVTGCDGYLVRRADAEEGPYGDVVFVREAAYAGSNLTAGATFWYRVEAVNGSRLSAESSPVSATVVAPLVVPCFAVAADGRGITCGGGTVSLRLSGALDERLELVCSDTLAVPVETWMPVPDASVADAGDGTGAIVVSVSTNAPCLFFTVRVK